MDNYSFIDRSEIAEDWHARGFSCGLWIDHAGREWSYHAQETDELFMMMSGELELELEDQSMRPSVGEEIRIPAGMPHTIRNVGGKTARWFYGQRRETTPVLPTPDASEERSFYPEVPEVKRKRRPDKRMPALEVSKEPGTHSIS